jgi:hypothetical protein
MIVKPLEYLSFRMFNDVESRPKFQRQGRNAKLIRFEIEANRNFFAFVMKTHRGRAHFLALGAGDSGRLSHEPTIGGKKAGS